MVEVTGALLLLYNPVNRYSYRVMKFLSILMVGVALPVGGCVQLEKAPVTGAINLGVPREKSIYELEKREGAWYAKGETEAFNGTQIVYREDGSKKWETAYVDGERHGTCIFYREDGSKQSETPWVHGKAHGTGIGFHKDGAKSREIQYVNSKKYGTEIVYHEDGSKSRKTVWENGVKISETYF